MSESISVNYQFKKHPDTSKEVGGLIINDKDASNSKLVIEIMKNLSKKLITLNVIDMLKFSRPAKLTSPYTVLSCSGNEYALTGLLTKAYHCADPIERMKYVVAFAISGIHCSPDLCKSKAPFNPIVGETYQAKTSDGSMLYMEQTMHVPPTLNFNIVGPDKIFEVMGFGAIDAKLDGLNKIRGARSGKNIIKFKDGTMYTFSNLYTRINGVMFGDRIYNYYGDLVVKDYKNKIEAIASFQDELSEGVLQKLFAKKKTVQYDECKIEIRQLNPTIKQKELKATGVASWLGQVVFDDKVYWSYFDENKTEWSQEGLWILPSDSFYREDLNAVVKGDIDLAQKEKERLEELQRADQRLRDAYKAKHSN